MHAKRRARPPLLAIQVAAALAAAAPLPDAQAQDRLPPATSSTATSDTASPNAPAASALAEGKRAARSAVTDTMTTARIKAALAADDGMKEADVSVSTADGVVTLEGSVRSREQAAIAASLAQRQEGVVRVESRLNVR